MTVEAFTPAEIDYTGSPGRLNRAVSVSPAAPSLAEWAKEMAAAAQIAKALVPTAFCPDSLKVRDGRGNLDYDASVAQCAAALLTGQEIGLSPMASLRSIDVIPPGSGVPALRANAQRGLLQRRGHDLRVEESTQTRAVVRGRRAGEDWNPEPSVWTEERARKAIAPGAYNDPKGAWQRNPTAQLVARATAEAARWTASDALLGLPYTVEEIQDLDGSGPQDQPEPPGGAPDPATGPARRRAPRRRKSEAPPAGGAPASPGAGPASRTQPGATTPGDRAPDEGEPAAPIREPITRAQRAALWAGLRELGYTPADRDEALAAISSWVGADIASSNDLTADQAGRALTALQAEKDRRAAAAGEQQEIPTEQEDPDATTSQDAAAPPPDDPDGPPPDG